MSSGARVMLRRVALTVVPLVAAGTGAAWPRAHAAASESVTLAMGVVVAPGRGVVYVMAHPQGVDAVDERSGRVLWKSRAATVPLLLWGGRLLALADMSRGGRGLRLLMLDPATGAVRRALPPVELPSWVESYVGPAMSYSFTIDAVARGDTAVVGWRARQWHVSGAVPKVPPPVLVDSGAVAIDLAAGQVLGRVAALPSVQAPYAQNAGGGYTIGPFAADNDVQAEVTQRVSPEGTRVVLHRTRAGAPLADVVLAEAPQGALYLNPMVSADGRHVLVWQQLQEARTPIRYRLTVFTADGGDRVGELVVTSVPTRFIMAGRRLLGVFWVTEPRRADDARSLVELRALGPRSGALAFSHPVRDLRYRGPLPP